MRLTPCLLENAHIALEPYTPGHLNELQVAARSAPGIWCYMPDDLSTVDFPDWFEGALEEQRAGRAIFHAVRRKYTGVLCGSTSYLNIVPAHARVEIGYTWYVPDAQGTEVNPAAKLLMFANAFEAGAERVELKCDARNARSRAAMRKFGAVEEGTLRRHMRMPGGHMRDTVYYSVLREEWPEVRAHLLSRLE
ncbi:MAG: GNAT family N-acetyltransferase [Alphaproteobacteria bacterium]